MKKYIELGVDGVAFSMLETAVEPVGNFIEGDESNLGKKWDGKKFVDVVIPKKYKVWSKTAFVTICGRADFDAIVDGADKDLRYFKYILDSADIVDMNVPQYFGMVKLLNDKKIMSDAIFAALTVQE
jgi:hypothetical protein